MNKLLKICDNIAEYIVTGILVILGVGTSLVCAGTILHFLFMIHLSVGLIAILGLVCFFWLIVRRGL